jgi:periplasmic protein CpxP/Spy
MKRTLLTVGAAAVMAAGLVFSQTVSPAPTDPGTAPHHQMRHNRMARMAQQLNLTDAQKEQAKAIFAEARQASQPVRDQLKQNREALSAAVKAGNTQQIQQLSATQGSLMGQLTAIRTEAMAKFYAGLSAGQRSKADQMHQQFKQRMEQRSGARKNG